MKPQFFRLVKYEEIIPIVKELGKEANKDNFKSFYSKYIDIINNSEQIILNEDCLTGYEKGSIFTNMDQYSEELEFEILRPITLRQKTCFSSCLYKLYSDSPYYKNKEDRREQESIWELVDCLVDYDRCEKKKFISYSEYLLFEALLDMVNQEFKRIAENNN